MSTLFYELVQDREVSTKRKTVGVGHGREENAPALPCHSPHPCHCPQASTNFGGEQHLEFTAEILLSSSDDMSTVFYGKFLPHDGSTRADLSDRVLRGPIKRRVRFDAVRSKQAGRPLAVAWLNAGELPTPTVQTSHGTTRTIDLGYRNGGFVVYHDFQCGGLRSNEVTVEELMALDSDLAIDEVFHSTPTAKLDYFQMQIEDNLDR